jgi:magnesium chelatase subunit D
VKRRGGTPIVVVLTDGRANVGRDGAPGRGRAEEEAIAAARALRGAGVTAVLVDVAPRPHPLAERLAAEMHAAYVPLPHADARAVSDAVRMTTAAAGHPAAH